ncbi:MAG: sensor domain-containing diguanylate cyclase [Candidatus Baltobacteraceae bacterium]|jgi:diguanylate cyclase (GGDEF)-like protein
MRTSAESCELRSLNARLLQLERECSDARDEGRLLTALFASFTKIATARAPEEAVAAMLRAAHEPLGFARAIYFRVERERGIVAEQQLDRSDAVEPSHEIPDLRPGSALLSVLRDDLSGSVGRAGELSAPLVDVRDWYVVSPLSHAEGTLGVLYVDGHRSPRPREWEAGLVHALTTIAAVSIQNGVLFAKTQALAAHDPLTGILNRRTFDERLNAELVNSRESARSLVYVMIDVDDFKKINDSAGHAYGDSVLRKVAETLVRSSRSQDVVARYAGDEFAVLLVDVEGSRAHDMVARLSLGLRGNGLRCSLGAALFPYDAQDGRNLMIAADRALYAAKSAGKNGFAFA